MGPLLVLSPEGQLRVERGPDPLAVGADKPQRCVIQRLSGLGETAQLYKNKETGTSVSVGRPVLQEWPSPTGRRTLPLLLLHNLLLLFKFNFIEV